MAPLPPEIQDFLDSITGLLMVVPGLVVKFWAVEVGLAVALGVLISLPRRRR